MDGFAPALVFFSPPWCLVLFLTIATTSSDLWFRPSLKAPLLSKPRSAATTAGLPRFFCTSSFSGQDNNWRASKESLATGGSQVRILGSGTQSGKVSSIGSDRRMVVLGKQDSSEVGFTEGQQSGETTGDSYPSVLASFSRQRQRP